MHADCHKALPEELRSIYNPWPFHTWGIDILGPFALAIRQLKYLIVAIEYFTKWIEAELVAQITAHKVQHFVWKNIVSFWGAKASHFRQWHLIREPTVGEAMYRSRNQAGVCINRTPPDKWAGRVSKPSFVEGFEAQNREG